LRSCWSDTERSRKEDDRGGGSEEEEQRVGSTTGSTSSNQANHWNNSVQDVIKSTRFLVSQVTANPHKREGDRLRIGGVKGRPGAR
jgi:hypothetical protein